MGDSSGKPSERAPADPSSRGGYSKPSQRAMPSPMGRPRDAFAFDSGGDTPRYAADTVNGPRLMDGGGMMPPPRYGPEGLQAPTINEPGMGGRMMFSQVPKAGMSRREMYAQALAAPGTFVPRVPRPPDPVPPPPTPTPTPNPGTPPPTPTPTPTPNPTPYTPPPTTPPPTTPPAGNASQYYQPNGIRNDVPYDPNSILGSNYHPQAGFGEAGQGGLLPAQTALFLGGPYGPKGPPPNDGKQYGWSQAAQQWQVMP
jgi:hypothetical protein